MKVIVGLGNPGTQYTHTRHNVGFMVIDALVGRLGQAGLPKARFQGVCSEASVGGERVLLLKPTTFMNRSGQSVAEAIRFYKATIASDLLVIVDDLYLACGVVRVKPGGGTGGHNGLASIEQSLGTSEYPRVRVGVGMLPNGGKPAHVDQADYVLGRPLPEEEDALRQRGLPRAIEAAEHFLTKGLTHAMNACNGQ